MGPFIASLITVFGIGVVAYGVYQFQGFFVEKFVRATIKPDHYSSKESEVRREDTLIRVFGKIFRAVIIFVAVVMSLSELGIDVRAFLAAAGILGVAIGFGTQSLFKDFFTGILMVMENQYRVGDYVCVDATCGVVEDVTLRVLKIRDTEGTVVYVPHGEVKRLANKNRGYSRVNLNIKVSASQNLDRLVAVINGVGDDLFAHPEWRTKLHTPPHFVSIEDLGEANVMTVRVSGDTAPTRQLEVASELRRRIKLAFEREGIEAPFVAPAPKPKTSRSRGLASE